MYKRFTSPKGNFKNRSYTLHSKLTSYQARHSCISNFLPLYARIFHVCKFSLLVHLFMQEITLFSLKFKVCIIPKVCKFLFVSFPHFLQEVMCMHNIFGKFRHSFPAIGAFFQIFMAIKAQRTIAPNMNMKNKKFLKYVKKTCTTLGLIFLSRFFP